MRTLLALIAMTATAAAEQPSVLTFDSGVILPCAVASISMVDKSVTIDAECIEKSEREWMAGRGDRTSGAYAHVIAAILRGEEKRR